MDEDGLLALGRYGAGSAGWRSAATGRDRLAGARRYGEGRLAGARPLRGVIGLLALAATGRD